MPKFRFTMSDGCSDTIQARDRETAHAHIRETFRNCGDIAALDEIYTDGPAAYQAPKAVFALSIPITQFARFINEVLNPIESYVAAVAAGDYSTEPSKIPWIKAYREISGVGLRDAKYTVEGLIEERAGRMGVDLAAAGKRNDEFRNLKLQLQMAIDDYTNNGANQNPDLFVDRRAISAGMAEDLIKRGYKLVLA